MESAKEISVRERPVDAFQDFSMITKLVFWSAARILLDLTAAVHI